MLKDCGYYKTKILKLNKYMSLWVEGDYNNKNTLFIKVAGRITAINCSNKKLVALEELIKTYLGTGVKY